MQASTVGVLQLPRHPRQYARARNLPQGDGACVAACPSAAQPTAPHELETVSQTGRTLDSITQDSASLSKRAFLRQTPKVGAVCGKTARADLCGVPLARAVPTATVELCRASMVLQDAATRHLTCPDHVNACCTYGLVILHNRVICVKQMCSSEIWRDSKRAYHVGAEDQESAVRIRPLPAV